MSPSAPTDGDASPSPSPRDARASSLLTVSPIPAPLKAPATSAGDDKRRGWARLVSAAKRAALAGDGAALFFACFLALAYVVAGEPIFRDQPGPWSSVLVDGFAVPGPEQARVVLTSLFVGVPALWAWRAGLKRFVAGPLATHWAGLRGGTPKHAKFTQQVVSAVHYNAVFAGEVWVLSGKDWWPSSDFGLRAISVPRDVRRRDQADVGLALVYGAQLAWYALELLTVLLTPGLRRRKDGPVLLAHHAYCVALIAGSWCALHHRVGSLVLLAHDAADCFLPLAKALVYAGPHIKRTRDAATYEAWRALGTSLFACFIVAFAVPRLVFFAGVIWTTTARHQWLTMCWVGPGLEQRVPCPRDDPSADKVLVGLLVLLYGLEAFWGFQIAHMVVRVFGKLHEEASAGAGTGEKEYEDVRSEEE